MRNGDRRRLVPGLVAVAAGLLLAPSAAAQEGMSFFKSRGGEAQVAADTAGVTIIDLPSALARDMFVFPGEPATSPLLELHRRLDRIAGMDRIDTVVIRADDAMLGLTDVEEIVPAFARLREAGKKVVVFAEFYGPSQLALAAHADQAWIQDGSVLSLPGLAIEEMYLADMLGWLGVTADLVQVGDYKGANETMTRAEPSKAWDENIEGLLDGLYTNLRGLIMSGRRMSGSELDAAMEEAWSAMAQTGIDVGLLDGVADRTRLEEAVAGWMNVEEVELVEAPDAASGGRLGALGGSNPFAAFGELMRIMQGPQPQKARRGSVAVLHISGPIVDGQSSNGGLFGGSAVTGSHTVREAIDAIMEQDMIEGVVVRIDSPGGSAVASEVIWQGLRQLSETRPVWVSIGSMAASGGYYCAVGGDRIFVNPTSIVGSIGVVGGKISLGGLMDKMKINVVTRTRGPRADLLVGTAPFTDEQRELYREKIGEIYEVFTGRVTEGRPGIDLSRTAEGRLFVGSDAVGLGMADEVAGFTEVIERLAADRGLEAGAYDVLEYPEPPSFESLLEEMFGLSARANVTSGPAAFSIDAALASLRPIIGEAAYRAAREHLTGLMLLHSERAVLMSPRAIIVR